MITFMILALVLFLIIAFVVLVVGAISAAGIVVFGDAIVCILIIFAIVKLLARRKKRQ